VLLDDRDDITRGLLHTTPPERRYFLQVRRVHDPSPGKRGRKPARQSAIAGGYYDCFCPEALHFRLDGVEALVDERRPHLRGDDNRYFLHR
jgi:hypothetical protein